MRLLKSLAQDLDRQVDRSELRGLARNSSDAGWFLLVLAGLYMLVLGSDVLRPGLAAVVVGLYLAYTLLMRFAPAFRQETRLKILLELVGMIAFITVFLYCIDARATLLLILYLFPVVIAALTLGRWATLGITILSVGGFMLVALLRDLSAPLSGRDIVELVVVLPPFLLVAYITALLAAEIDTAKERIRILSETDELTGLSNLRAFSRLHRQEHERAVRHRRSYSILMMDLNGLKRINESFGHETGDRAIILFANVIARLIRSTDAAARLGGDEFVALLSETDAEQTARVINRLRAATERCTIEANGHMVRLSVSVGVASFPTDSEDARDLVGMADKDMYRDKLARRKPPVEAEAPSTEVA